MKTTHIQQTLWLVSAGIVTALTLVCCSLQAAEMTNSIPQDLFVTDDGKLFWYKGTGQMVVSTQMIKDAEKSSESRPAGKDTEGHWGPIVNGFQMSVRLEKPAFTVNEPVLATVLIRNVTNTPLTFFETYMIGWPFPFNISVTKNGKTIERKGAHKPTDGSTRDAKLFPQTQFKYQVKLDKYFDLTNAAEYSFSVSYRGPAKEGVFEVASQKVSFAITDK